MENNHFIENEPLAAEDDGAPLPEAVEFTLELADVGTVVRVLALR